MAKITSIAALFLILTVAGWTQYTKCRDTSPAVAELQWSLDEAGYGVREMDDLLYIINIAYEEGGYQGVVTQIIKLKKDNEVTLKGIAVLEKVRRAYQKFSLAEGVKKEIERSYKELENDKQDIKKTGCKYDRNSDIPTSCPFR